jgi:signal transduction histidine kinase
MTLRKRFFLTMLVACGATLGLVGTVVYLETRSALGKQFDDTFLERLVHAKPVGFLPGSPALGLCAAAHQLQLIDEAGGVVSACPVTRLPQPLPGAIRDALVTGRALYRAEVEGTPVRMAILPHSRPEEQRRLLIQAGEPLKPLFQARAALKRSFLLAFAGAVIFLVLISYIAVGRAFIDVERVAERARSILRGDLAGRVEGGDADGEMGALVKVVNELFDRVAHAEAAQRRFVADAAREIREPLYRLRDELAGLLPSRQDPAELQEALDRVREDLRSIAELVDGLLLFARVDAGLVKHPDAVTDLSELARAAVESMRDRLARKSLQVETELAPGVVARGSRALLNVVARSFIDNAGRHASPRGRVRVTVQSEDGTARLTAEDDGTQVPVEDLARRFGPGLTLARDIAALHGGSVEVGVSPLGGARLDVRLPLAPP